MTTPNADDATARVDSDVRLTPYPRGPQAQFAPGTIIAGRYRIAGILGLGGMGEVYRADDTKLDQPVALKFLPARLARDQVLLGRLHDEVRLGRQIAHPNVCRIYDIVEWNGAHFLAMEFVDGEDLSRLLRRIGRLAHDKAVDIARGIAAGLMAAHAKGILHRDLKPANVMVDSHGEARIMDFGLALAAGEDDGTVSGTPAYMAPEQLEGKQATVQSDLYALGLVMYELFTGKRAHHARTLPERVRDISSRITTPSDVVRDLDPAVDRIILRCLSDDPAQRPRSAREVIEALPGGDPLAAAMAAGETPSPRLIAAAGTEGSLRPAIAWALLGTIVVLMAVTFAARRERGFLTRNARLERAPDALADRAATIVGDLGLTRDPFRASGFWIDTRYRSWIFTNERPGARWNRDRSAPAVMTFWMREQREPLIDYAGATLDASPDVPPMTIAGAKLIEIDQHGRLVKLKVVPDPSWTAGPVDANRLLAASGFEASRLQPADPQSLPPFYADKRAAWTGRHSDGTPVRIEAAWWRGKPVYFDLVERWDEAAAVAGVPYGRPYASARLMLFTVVAVIAIVLAWRNLRLRRGDRQGALRLAASMALLTLIDEVLRANHALGSEHELNIAATAAKDALYYGALFGVVYIALEPLLRRRWPDRLISWSRLLSGRWRDPMVGRDALIGVTGGMTLTAMASCGALWFLDMPILADLAALSRPAAMVAHLAQGMRDGIVQGMSIMMALMIFTLLLRRRALAIAATFLAILTMFLFATTQPSMVATQVIMTGLVVAAAARIGLLCVIGIHATFHTVFMYMWPEGLNWYTASALIPIAFVLAIAFWAFRTSLGGQRAFSPALLDE